jgi:hypothetical protein
MLIARAGDRDGSSGVYQAGTNPSEFAAADLTGDGRPEIAAVTPASASPAGLLPNATPAGSAFARFSPATLVPVISASRLVGFADFTRDGVLDLLTVSDTVASINPGLGNLAFGTRRNTSIPALPLLMRIADFDATDGPDILCLTSSNSTLMTLLNDGTGTLEPALTMAAGSSANAVAVADVDGNGSRDALVVSRGTSRLLVLLGNSDGTFTAATPAVIPINSVGVAAGDFNGDGDVDAAVVSQSSPRVLTVFTNSGTGAYASTQTLTLDLNPLDIAPGDFNGDGSVDLVVLTSVGRVMTFLGSGTGTFSLLGTSGLGFNSTRMVVADLNADGRSDLIYNAPNGGAGVTTSRSDGSLPPQGGTAGGNYFMTLNVPNTTTTDPDPVLTLRTQFNAWRNGLVGRVDAVQSVVNVPQLRTYGPGARSGVMRVTLRDWRGEQVTTTGLVVSVTRLPGGPNAVTAGTPTPLAPGVFDIPVTSSGDSLVPDRFEIGVQDGALRVVLMPKVSVRQSQCPSDFNGDGDVGTDADVAALFRCLAGDCCPVCLNQDVNGDGDAGTDQDIEAFFTALSGSCG